MTSKYIPLHVVVDKVLRDPLFNGLNWEAAIDYCVEFLGVVNVPDLFIEKTVLLKVKDWRAILPNDFVELKQLLIGNIPARYSTDSINDYSEVMNDDYRNNSSRLYNIKVSSDYTFNIKGGYIYTSIKEGDITISYYAIPIAADNTPQVPNDPKFLRALQSYIEVQHLRILFRNEKIQYAVLQDAEREYCWRVGQYQNASKLPSESQMQSIANMWKTLVPRESEFNTRFKDLGTRELIRNH